MALKIFTSNNYFYMVDTTDNRQYEGFAKDVRVRRELDSSSTFYFDNVNGWSATEAVALTNIQQEDGTAYANLAAFVTFYEENTGNFNSPGSGATLPANNAQVTTPIFLTSTQASSGFTITGAVTICEVFIEGQGANSWSFSSGTLTSSEFTAGQRVTVLYK